MKLLTLFWVMVIGGCFYAARGNDLIPAKHITTWTIVRGCAAPGGKTPVVAVVVFSDGTVQTVTNQDTPETKAAVQAAVGDLHGTIFQFPCGTDT